MPTKPDIMPRKLDLGNGYELRFTSWSPERDINPQYAGIPDDPHAGAIIKCGRHELEGHITLDTPVTKRVFSGKERWEVLSWYPLTLDTSVSAPCGCHGHIREGKWVDA